MASGTQLPWNDPGGTPCCCDERCLPFFDSNYWASGGNAAGVTLSQVQFFTLSSAQYAEIFAGGTFEVSNYSGSFSLSTRASQNDSFYTANGTLAPALNPTVVNVGGCTNNPDTISDSVQFGSGQPNSTATATFSGTACPEVNGTDSGSLTSALSIRYQLIDREDGYGVYVSAYVNMSLGQILINIPGTGSSSGGGSVLAKNNLITDENVLSPNIVFLGNSITIPKSQLLSLNFITQRNQLRSRTLNIVTSSSASFSAAVTHSPSAP